MADENEHDLEADAARLAAEVQESRARNRGAGKGGKKNLGAAAALLGTCAVIAAVMFWPEAKLDTETTLTTAEPDQFQTSTGAPFGDLRRPTPREPEPAQPDPELLAQIEALKSEIERLREQPEEAPEVDIEPVLAVDPQIERLLQQVSDLQDSMGDMQRENQNSLAERDRQLQILQTQLDAARLSGGNNDLDPAVDRRLEAEELYRARAASPMIAFGSGSGGAAGASGAEGASPEDFYPGMEGTDPNLRTQSQNERFAWQQAARAPMERAKVIANPSGTVMQGTMIQAVLETAVNTDLPGAIRALVSEDVHSFDGSRVLIPRGSRVIGAYNDNTDLGQRRAMIVWNRIILPDNQTVEIGAYGGDAIGQSGVEGAVNTHFGSRFGSAALISMIALAPSLALSDEDSDSNTSDIADAMSQTMSGAMTNTMSAYLNRKPTIAVKQGSLVTIMVDRDLEIF